MHDGVAVVLEVAADLVGGPIVMLGGDEAHAVAQPL